MTPSERPPADRPLLTIGVYDWTLPQFLSALWTANVRLLVDVRQRRGVRGPQYAWANSRRLQGALAQAEIAYLHRRDLAPTTELRQLQYREDDRLGVGKRSRVELAMAYRERYTREVLDQANLDSLLGELAVTGRGALFCVERDPEACHRSLIADRLREMSGVPIRHLRP